MVVSLGKDRRMVIPKEFIASNNIITDRKYNIVFDNGKIILDPDVSDVDLEIAMRRPKKTSNSSKPIESNLKEGQNFSRKCYTPCKLVIRSKRKYAEAACEKCKGFLLKDTADDIKSLCPYHTVFTCTDTPVVKIDYEKVLKESNIPFEKKQVNTLKENVSKLDHILNVKVSENSKKIHEFVKNITSACGNNYKSTVNIIEDSEELYKCSVCGELFQRGFKVDKDDYCTSCFKEDIKDFIEKYKEEKLK